jgi:hypothetical protein
VTRRGTAWLTAVGSVAAFATVFFLRMNAAYGPFNLSVQPGDWPSDWKVLWELWRYGQIAPPVIVEAAALGAGAALIPWGLWAVTHRRAR